VTLRRAYARRLLLAAAAIFVLLLPASAAAHAQLLEVRPADGSTVEGTPNEIVAVFDDELVADKSSLEIVDTSDERVALGGVDPTQPTHLLVRRPQLAIGTYEARWTAATADGHVERGTWAFTVAGAIKSPGTPAPTDAGTASEGPTAEASAAPTLTPTAATPSASPTPTDQTAAGGDVILPILVALAVVGIAAVWLLSRRGRPSGGV
jgi:methionine-rich copper-binding protein CopC